MSFIECMFKNLFKEIKNKESFSFLILRLNELILKKKNNKTKYLYIYEV